MRWLELHSQALQAVGALLTAAFALAALVGLKIQLDSSERIARETQARDIYRSFVALSLDNPGLASPGICPEFEGDDATAYDFYMEYTLYTAEQVIEMSPDWRGAFEVIFENHLPWLCDATLEGYTTAVETMVRGMQARHCLAVTTSCS